MSALSVYPCYEEECSNEFNIANNSSQDDHEEDACTPFCISGCCTSHIFYTSQPNTLSVSQKVITLNSTYTVKFTPLVVVSIWQPPKLA